MTAISDVVNIICKNFHLPVGRRAMTASSLGSIRVHKNLNLGELYKIADEMILRIIKKWPQRFYYKLSYLVSLYGTRRILVTL